MAETSDYNFKERFNRYKNTSKAKDWLNRNLNRVKAIFSDIKIRDYIFEPFKDVFAEADNNNEGKIKSAINLVAITNMVLAGIPGKLGVGVFVCMGLEAYMAYIIAREVGIKVKSVNDIWKYFGILAGVSLIILEGFKQLLMLSLSLFSVVPMMPPIILAELFVSNFVGVLFWVGFEEAKQKGSFKIPKRALKGILNRTKELFSFQKEIVVKALTIDNLKLVANRLKSWLKGEGDEVEGIAKAEMMSAVAIMYLIDGEYESFEGPMGKTFIDAIRRAYSTELGNASLEEMGEFFSNRTNIIKDIDYLKGEYFEHLINMYENNDGDEWTSTLNPIRNEKGYDLIFTNHITGEQIKVECKNVKGSSDIYDALENPDVIVITNNRIKEKFIDNDRIYSASDTPFGEFENIDDFEQVNKITAENVDKIIENLESVSAIDEASGTAVTKGIAMLWPFVIAFMRKRITEQQFTMAFEKVLGETGKTLASRIIWAIILGPVFAWYLLARSVILMVKGVENMALGDKPIIRTLKVS